MTETEFLGKLVRYTQEFADRLRERHEPHVACYVPGLGQVPLPMVWHEAKHFARSSGLKVFIIGSDRKFHRKYDPELDREFAAGSPELRGT